MLVSGVPNERMSETPEAKLVLRNGQVALGKVNKIYPNNRAEVQIGGNRIIAQIETPLAVGERYIFQVDKKSDHLVHLRVIGSQVSEMSQEHISLLLRQLNIRINDVSVNFVRSLINEQIPFNQKELVEALRLLNRVGNSESVQTMIKQMLLNKMPLQEGHLRALLAVNNNQLSNVMAKALQQLGTLNQSPQVTKLQSLLGSLINPPTTEQISSLPQAQVRSMVQTLQMLNYIQQGSSGINERDVVRMVQDQIMQAQQPQSQQTAGEEVRARTIANLLQELQQNTQQTTVRSSMINLVQQYKALHQQALNVMNEFNLSRGTMLSNEQFAQLQARVTNEIMPLLQPGEQEIVRMLLTTNNAQNINQIHALLQTFSSNQFYSVIMEALVAANEQSASRADFVPERFMLHTNQILQTFGMSHEAIVKNLPIQQEALPHAMLNINETVKALLLQVTQDERAPLENVQQLVHYINGLQLQTREESNLLHAQMQLPGEKIGLPDDLFIKFEGRKTKDDEIDTEFCRILFFLNLHHIEETIIDMNIQKRVITLTIYNDYDDMLAQQMHPYRKLLSDGLEKLNYHLSNIRFKPLEEESQTSEPKQNIKQKSPTSQEGFDLRI